MSLDPERNRSEPPAAGTRARGTRTFVVLAVAVLLAFGAAVVLLA